MAVRSSLRRSLIMLSVGVLVLYYVLVFLFSALFMEPYYLHKVEQTLIHAYETIIRESEYDLTTISELEEHNLEIIIADLDTCNILYNSRSGRPAPPEFETFILPTIRDQASASDTGYNIMTDERQEHTAAGASYSSGKRMVLGGVSDRYILDISTSYASISESSAISMQFSLIVGLMVMILAILAFSRMSAMVVEPITQITSTANQIAHLDFSQKCSVNIGGEIGDMARSVNTMSDFMQTYTQQLQDANRQLMADIQQKKEQEEARKNLVANLSHDLKTPIGLIAGYADGLRSGMAKTDAEIRDYCDVIRDESDRMMSMILKMMELFRLESGTVELEHEEFDLYDLLSYEIEIFSVEIERAGIRFTSDFTDSLYVTTDYFAAEQVITNYMQNAISHMGPGREMSLRVEDAGDYYRVSIFNSAERIQEEELPRLWESFYRLDQSRGRDRQHSGLGLSIVKSNMDLLGCDYGVRNTEGGVVFWAEFPKSPAPETEKPAE